MAVREVVQTTEEPVTSTRETVQTEGPVSSGVMAARIVWYVTGVIVTLLALRLVLQLLGANDDNGFVSFIYGLSGIFAGPFFGMFSYEPAYGISYFEISTFVAMLVYLLLGWGIARLFTLRRGPAAV